MLVLPSLIWTTVWARHMPKCGLGFYSLPFVSYITLSYFSLSVERWFFFHARFLPLHGCIFQITLCWAFLNCLHPEIARRSNRAVVIERLWHFRNKAWMRTNVSSPPWCVCYLSEFLSHWLSGIETWEGLFSLAKYCLALEETKKKETESERENHALSQKEYRPLQTYQVTPWHWCRTIQLNPIIWPTHTEPFAVVCSLNKPQLHSATLSPLLSLRCLHREMVREMGLMESNSILRQIHIS